ncbi:DNA repair protein rhp42 [Rhizoctonia solani 123E]|uniref:DNA repair protein rhp42 n=1 Tax=Rhizoctonia solani 123E TaxID=1423351 RepID=A0A074SB92_9AGAM|nr:DNA repair protein rhp42 [Rhizoctonia solani 123E]
MDSTDEEDFWDEVEVPQPVAAPQTETIEVPLTETQPHQPLDYNIEITITKKGVSTSEEQAEALAKKRQAAAHDRLIRLESHKLHAVALLASLSIRNKWLNDEALKARLLSMVPLPIQHGFTSVTKSAHPDPARRGRLFETALVRLTSWFAPSSSASPQNILMDRPSGWFRITNAGHIKTHTFEAGVQRIQTLEKREVERKVRHAKRQERRAKRARARIKGKGKARDPSSSSSDGEEDGLEVSDPEDEWYAPERLRSPNSIAKHALQRSGSRDVAALIFVAIVRALGIPARLVSSLQCVAWSIPKDYSSKGRRPKKAVPALDQDEASAEMEEVIPLGASSRVASPSSIGANSVLSVTTHRADRSVDHSDNSTRLQPSIKRKRGVTANDNSPRPTVEVNRVRQRGDASAGESSSKDRPARPRKNINHDSTTGSPTPPTIKLRRARPAGHVLGNALAPGGGTNTSANQSNDSPPTLWAEVFSRPDGRWIPVDPVRGIVNRAGLFERRDQAGKRKTDKLMYVVAMEEDGYARDVTARYAKNFGAHQARARARIAAGRKNGKIEWWDSVMRTLKRPYALHRDDVEDAELSHQLALEGLPSSIGAFKDHPIYALERHLRRDEAIHPRTEIAHFRGEPVFPRRNVLSLKPAEGWMRQGKILRQGMQPIKMVKARASTVRKKRELEFRREDEGEVMVGMYAEWQTELYKPPPVINGKIPTNDFGNIDLYVPTMLPEGAVHIPHKGCTKLARKLGISFAEAVTGFEFRKRQATPIITGIVIAAENEEVFMQALASHVQSEQLREAAKRRERVLQRWTRLVQGLRIVRRVNEQYSGVNRLDIDENAYNDDEEAVEPGGFLDDLKDVVRPYNLPQAQLIVPKLIIEEEDRGVSKAITPQTPLPDMPDSLSHAWAPLEDDEDPHAHIGPEALPEHSPNATYAGPPLTMQELADELSKAREQTNSEALHSETNGTTIPTAIPSLEKESGHHITQASLEIDEAKDNRSDANQDNVVEATPKLRRSSRRHNPLPAAPTAPTPMRTLRPRRKP